MNPQHGQASCDIAVGVRNSPVAAATNSQPSKRSCLYVYSKYAAGAADETPTEGMNPPHGQQNHRCDIAVGLLWIVSSCCFNLRKKSTFKFTGFKRAFSCKL
jgi:hypothetical protein